VLPICVGRATRLARFLAGGVKEYEATVRLGFATTTDDRTGQPLGPPRPVEVSREQVEAATRTFLGTTLQTPPAFSAKHVGGRRAYERARAGESVAVAPREVTVHALTVRDLGDGCVTVLVRCSAGTYVRALGRDLGAALGTGGHLTALRRTRSGGFGLERAVAAEELTPAVLDRLVPLRECLPDLPWVRVTEEGRRALVHGRALSRGFALSGFPEDAPEERYRLLAPDGDLLALAVPTGFDSGDREADPRLQPDVVLIGPDPS
jgi:tRNA pseudouridine55 synthase